MRVLVCGGRDYRDRARVARLLDAAVERIGLTVVIQGGQVTIDPDTDERYGADYLAAEWAVARGVPVEEYKADWKTLGRAAGPIRNQRMIDEGKPQAVIALPGGRGTADMVRRAETANIEVYRA